MCYSNNFIELYIKKEQVRQKYTEPAEKIHCSSFIMMILRYLTEMKKNSNPF